MFEKIPSVDALTNAAQLAPWTQRLPRPVVVDAVREILAELRERIARNDLNGFSFEVEHLAQRISQRLENSLRPPLVSAINATGIILHTGLGRAPLADEAVAALQDVAPRYAPVELDLETGERGRRADVVRSLLCQITAAECATVVNNNAAATMLVLATVARGKAVIVSRGELIEIGGSFRLPQVMEAGGAALREVGTTNRTHLADYESAIDESTAALMKVHASNYRIEGFTKSVEIDALVELGRKHNLPVIHDIGSGLLRKMDYPALADEPDASSSIAAGADLVLFSGDKLLGGPQCGIIVGKTSWIDRIEKNPLMRAVRVDKLTLAALGATLQLHRDPQLARQRLPICQMLDTSIPELERRAAQIIENLRSHPNIREISKASATAYLGGGSMPTKEVPSIAIKIECNDLPEEGLARRLRTGEPPIIARVQRGAVWLDLRTIFPDQDDLVTKAISAALTGGATSN